MPVHRHEYVDDVCVATIDGVPCRKVRDPDRGGRPAGVTTEVDEDGLTFRERQVVDLLEEHTQAEVARTLDISRQQVGQIVKRLREKGKLPK